MNHKCEYFLIGTYNIYVTFQCSICEVINIYNPRYGVIRYPDYRSYIDTLRFPETAYLMPKITPKERTQE